MGPIPLSADGVHSGGSVGSSNFEGVLLAPSA